MDIIGSLEREWQEHKPGHAKPPVPAVQSSIQAQPEVPVTSFGSKLHRFATVAETVGEDAAEIFEAVASNPETKAGLLMLARMASLPVGAGTITAGLAGLGAIEAIWRAGQQGQQQPSPPAPAPMQPKPSFTPGDSATAQAPVVR